MSHHGNNNPLYPSLDQFNQPGHNQHSHNQHGSHNTNQHAYQPHQPQQQQHPQFPQGNGGFYNSYANTQQGGKHQVFDDLGGTAGLLTGMAFGPVGSSMLANANNLVGKNVSKYLNYTHLKYYFNVNNSYVFNKIKLLLCPFLHKSWKRRIGRYNEVDSYVPPREDINAPDLYIPVMSFVTYVLLVGVTLGTNLKFTPEVLGGTASTGLIILAFEVFLIKAGFYLLNCGNISIYDLIAYCGYKFVGVVVNIFVGMLSSTYGYLGATLYTGIGMAVFMVRTLRIVLVLEQSGAGMLGGGGGGGMHMGGMHGGMSGPGMGMGPGTGAGVIPGTGSDGTLTRNYFLLVVAVLQILLVYVLGVSP